MENRYVGYCKNLVEGLCPNSEVSVVRKQDEMGVLLSVSGVIKQDMGSLIGRKGTHINYVRELVRVVGAMDGARVSVKIDEPEGSLRPKNE